MGRTQLSVVLMIICAVKCLAMSYDELEDFADYLKRTSQLSPILKKGVEADEPEDDEVVSDDAWEESGKFEGDLILNERQRRLIVESVSEGLSRNGIKDGTKRWPNNEVIYYIQVEHFRHDQIQAINNAIDDLQQASCVKFRRYRKGDPDAVVIQGSRRGCFSQVGYQSGYQVLNLSGRHPAGRGCFRHGTIVHEMLHTLGFYHMQSSPVRDDYVDIVWDNIVKAARHNFRKYNSFSVSNFGVTYDYESVLHYSKHAFSLNGKDTIIPKQRGAVIGQRIGLSEKDTLKLNKMYCDAESNEEEPNNNKKKKKVIKKKPKQIQGLGYHQGKAVVFKVPTASPHKFHQTPRPYSFHYFSQTPKILPPSENEYNTGKEMTYVYKPHEKTLDDYEEPQYYNNGDAKQYHGSEIESPNQQQIHNNVADVKDANEDNSNKANDSPNYIDTTVKILDNTETQEPSIIEAIDRLSKIIKAHVYPSQTPDFDIYKMNDQDDHEDNTEKVKKKHVDLVIIAPIKKPISQVDKMNTAMRFINKLFDLSKYESYKTLQNQYHPSIDDYYEDDEKSQYNKKDKLPLKEKDVKYIDPSYTESFSDYDDDYEHLGLSPYTMRYGAQDDYSKFPAKLLGGEKSHGNHDDCQKNIYAPYKYNPNKYNKGARLGYAYIQDSSEEDQQRPASAPFRYILVPGTNPLDNYYNDMKDQEYYR